jgi:hypothetical protein
MFYQYYQYLICNHPNLRKPTSLRVEYQHLGREHTQCQKVVRTNPNSSSTTKEFWKHKVPVEAVQNLNLVLTKIKHFWNIEVKMNRRNFVINLLADELIIVETYGRNICKILMQQTSVLRAQQDVAHLDSTCKLKGIILGNCIDGLSHIGTFIVL